MAKIATDDAGDSPAANDGVVTQTDDELRHERIARAAYYRAERRNFQSDGELDDWLEAERELDSFAASGGIQGEALSEGTHDLSAER